MIYPSTLSFAAIEWPVERLNATLKLVTAHGWSFEPDSAAASLRDWPKEGPVRQLNKCDLEVCSAQTEQLASHVAGRTCGCTAALSRIDSSCLTY